MSYTRTDMLASLKQETVPALRRLGFKGSGQHFYRQRRGQVDLLTFQFSMFPGRLIAEISYVTSEGENTNPIYVGTPAAKLRVAMTGKRLRLGRRIKQADPWFVYCNPLQGEHLETPDAIASTFSHLIEAEGEQWWHSRGA